MTNRYAVLILSAFLLCLASCREGGQSAVQKSHEPTDVAAFISAMQHSLDMVVKSQDTDKRWDVRNQAHRELFRDYPVYYDWWIQDGDDIHWFQGDLLTNLMARLNKLGIKMPQRDSVDMLQEGFKSYIEFCTERRKQRLASLWRHRRRLCLQNSMCCSHRFSPIPKVRLMPATNAITFREESCP